MPLMQHYECGIVYWVAYESVHQPDNIIYEPLNVAASHLPFFSPTMAKSWSVLLWLPGVHTLNLTKTKANEGDKYQLMRARLVAVLLFRQLLFKGCEEEDPLAECQQVEWLPN